MMYQQVIARRYAKGLMLSAKDGELEHLENELKILVDALLGGENDLLKLFSDPAFSPLDQKAVMKRIKEASGMSDSLYRFLLLLIDKGRFMLLPIIHHAFTSFIDERRGRVRAKIESATPISPDYIDEIESALKKICKKEVLATASLAPELLGGIRVEVAGLIFDGTVKAKLDAIKHKLAYEI